MYLRCNRPHRLLKFRSRIPSVNIIIEKLTLHIQQKYPWLQAASGGRKSSTVRSRLVKRTNLAKPTWLHARNPSFVTDMLGHSGLLICAILNLLLQYQCGHVVVYYRTSIRWFATDLEARNQQGRSAIQNSLCRYPFINDRLRWNSWLVFVSVRTVRSNMWQVILLCATAKNSSVLCISTELFRRQISVEACGRYDLLISWSALEERQSSSFMTFFFRKRSSSQTASWL